MAATSARHPAGPLDIRPDPRHQPRGQRDYRLGSGAMREQGQYLPADRADRRSRRAQNDGAEVPIIIQGVRQERVGAATDGAAAHAGVSRDAFGERASRSLARVRQESEHPMERLLGPGEVGDMPRTFHVCVAAVR
jgi:hypothetical protein